MRYPFLALCFVIGFSLNLYADSEKTIYEPVFDGQILIREAGSPKNQTILLVHGVGTEASHVWDALVPLLAENFHVLAIDLPGFGKSSKENLLYAPDRYASLLRWLLDEYKTGPVYLVGHSMGGAISLCFAGTYPHSVKRMVLADPYGILHRIALVRYSAKQAASEKSFLFKAPIKLFNGMLNSITNIFNDASVNHNIDQILSDPLARKTSLGGKPERIAGLALVNYDFGWALERVQAQTLIVWGEQDRVSPFRTAILLNHKICDSNLEIISNAGHTPPYEQPEIFNHKVLNFLTAEFPEKKSSGETIEPEIRKFRVIRNIRKFDQIYEGDYDSLFIVRSKRVLLDKVRANYIEIRSSGVTIKNSEILADSVGINIAASDVIIESSRIVAHGNGIQARGIELEMTGVYVEADTALAVSRSKFDLAGCDFVGQSAAIASDVNNRAHLPVPDLSEFLFSVCTLKSSHSEIQMHGTLEISPDSPK